MKFQPLAIEINDSYILDRMALVGPFLGQGLRLIRWLLACSLATNLIMVGTSTPAEARVWKKKFENRLKLMPIYYFEDVGQGTSQWTTAMIDEPDFSLRTSSALKFRFAPWLYADPSAKSVTENFVADFNEVNADYRSGDWLIRVGINSVSWGATDVFNPLDVVSARRYIDPLNSEKRGVPSIDFNWEKNAWRLEAIYLPIQFDSILPGEYSRWLPRDVTYNRDTSIGKAVIDTQFRYHYTDKLVLDSALNNNFGFRIERHGVGLDLTAIFFQGAPTAPAIFTPVISGRTSADLKTFYASDITLQPVYYLRRTSGIGAVWTLDSLIVRFAAANSDRLTARGKAMPGWTQNAVLGLEKNFAIFNSTLTVLLQTTYAQNEDLADNTVASLDRIFDRSWLLGFRLATSSEWNFQSATLYDAVFGGWFNQLKIERKMTDTLTGSLQADWLEGEAGTPFGTYRRNRRLNLGLAVFF